MRKAARGAKSIKALMAMDTPAILDIILAEPLIVDLYVKAEVFKAKDGEIYLRLIDWGIPDVKTIKGEKVVKLKEGVLKR